jgi:NADH-quinone oxidoreductase subunit N
LNLSLLKPEITMAAAAVLVILLDLFIKQKYVTRYLSLAGLVVAGVFAVIMWGDNNPALFNNMLAADNFAVFFKLLFLGIAFLVILSSSDYENKFSSFKSEYYALILISTLGMMLMASAADMISLFISLELASIPLYVLVSLLKDKKSTESALKYLLLGAIASAVVLYGMALVFGATGETQLAAIAQSLQTGADTTPLGNPGLYMGIVLMVAGFGFKIAAVPFQMWVPDVYEGAPTTITAYLSVASKAAGFAIILRVFFTAFGIPFEISNNWGIIFAVLSVISMFIGNIAAIPQTNIKRMLGYSSIAQAGYLMVGLATFGLAMPSTLIAESGLLFFLVSYALTNLGAFIAVVIISGKINSDAIADYAGLGKRSPLLALALTFCLISLIGIPPTAGFMAKFYIFSLAVEHGLLWLVVLAVINSVISAYYYLRVVKVMWFNESPATGKMTPSVSPIIALVICCLGVLLLGVIPGLIMKFAESASSLFPF